MREQKEAAQQGQASTDEDLLIRACPQRDPSQRGTQTLLTDLLLQHLSQLPFLFSSSNIVFALQVLAWRERQAAFEAKMEECVKQAGLERENWLQKVCFQNLNPLETTAQSSCEEQLAVDKATLHELISREVSLLGEKVA